MKFEKKEDYLLVTISDVVINFQRAHEIFNFIGEECRRLNCNKVLLDERSVTSRELTSVKIMNLSKEMAKKGLNKIHIAFWCQVNLINKDSELLRLYTYNNGYVVQYFTERETAIAWLKIQTSEQSI
jgi:hypothetical protein